MTNLGGVCLGLNRGKCFAHLRDLLAGFLILRGHGRSLDGFHGLGHGFLIFSNCAYACGGVSGHVGEAHLKERGGLVHHGITCSSPCRFERGKPDREAATSSCAGKCCGVSALRRVDDLKVDVKPVFAVFGSRDDADRFAVAVGQWAADHGIGIERTWGERFAHTSEVGFDAVWYGSAVACGDDVSVGGILAHLDDEVGFVLGCLHYPSIGRSV